jgi:hypothetical protein
MSHCPSSKAKASRKRMSWILSNEAELGEAIVTSKVSLCSSLCYT